MNVDCLEWQKALSDLFPFSWLVFLAMAYRYYMKCSLRWLTLFCISYQDWHHLKGGVVPTTLLCTALNSDRSKTW